MCQQLNYITVQITIVKKFYSTGPWQEKSFLFNPFKFSVKRETKGTSFKSRKIPNPGTTNTPSSLESWGHVPWRHDTQHNDIQHNNTHHYSKKCDAQCWVSFMVFFCSVLQLKPLCSMSLRSMSLCWMSYGECHVSCARSLALLVTAIPFWEINVAILGMGCLCFSTEC